MSSISCTHARLEYNSRAVFISSYICISFEEADIQTYLLCSPILCRSAQLLLSSVWSYRYVDWLEVVLLLCGKHKSFVLIVGPAFELFVRQHVGSRSTRVKALFVIPADLRGRVLIPAYWKVNRWSIASERFGSPSHIYITKTSTVVLEHARLTHSLLDTWSLPSAPNYSNHQDGSLPP